MNAHDNIKHYIRNNRATWSIMCPEQRRAMTINIGHLSHCMNVQKVINTSDAIYKIHWPNTDRYAKRV